VPMQRAHDRRLLVVLHDRHAPTAPTALPNASHRSRLLPLSLISPPDARTSVHAGADFGSAVGSEPLQIRSLHTSRTDVPRKVGRKSTRLARGDSAGTSTATPRSFSSRPVVATTLISPCRTMPCR